MNRIAVYIEELLAVLFSGEASDSEAGAEAIKLSAPVNYTIRKHTVKLSANRWIVSETNY
jgi:hypothetical protein